MGKTTGFLDYERVERPCAAPEERLQSFSDPHGPLPAPLRREQGARCMNCGVPFCQSAYGCPLHNLIPEWNDEIWAGNLRHALSRLLKSNNFPEFTGRVCPAPCENACVCGLHGAPVTVRDNELSIIERAWERGLMAPQPPEVRSGKRVAVVGSGPAGLAAAEQLNRRGHSVTVFERDDRPGGLLTYGIPNMKLEKTIVARRIERMRAEGIDFVCSTEIGRDLNAAELRRDFNALLLCCGARQPRVPAGIDCGREGVLQALDYLTAATRAVLAGGESALSAAGRRVLVVGNGDTATDCVATALRQGAASVVQLVRKPKPAAGARIWPYRPVGEKTDYGQEEAAARFGQDPRLYSSTVEELLWDGNGALRAAKVRTDGVLQELPAELLLLAAGFSGAEPAVADAFGLSLDPQGRLGGSDHRTEDPQVFACGDLRRGPSLVAAAIADGRACARAADTFLEGYSYL